MAFPDGVVRTTVVDQYLDATGRPVEGSVTFIPDLSAAGEGISVAPVPVRRYFDGDGKFEVSLPASVNTGLDPDFVYRVKLQFKGSIFPPDRYVQIPVSNTPVTLSDLIDVPVAANPARFQLPAAASNPLNPQDGQVYYRTTNGKVYYYDGFGEEWVNLGEGGGPGGDDYVTEPQLNAVVIQLEAEISENSLAITGLGTSKANTVHTHSIANVTGLQTVLDGKQVAGSYAASTHTHTVANVTGLQTTLDSKANTTDVTTALATKANTSAIATVGLTGDYNDLSNKPTIPTVPVTSVAGKTGAVTLAKADVGLGNVDNTSDANKPVSSAVQTALNAKAPTTHSHAVSDVTGLQTALDGKLPLIRSWNGSAYVADTDALIFVGPTDPGAVPDGSVWIEIA